MPNILIEDGNRLIFVTEDESVKQKLREIDSGTVQKMPLVPPKNHIGNQNDTETLSQCSIDDVMNIFIKLNEIDNVAEKQKKLIFCKKKIKDYLDFVNQDTTDYDVKLYMINEDMNAFVEASVKGILSQLGCRTIDDVLMQGEKRTKEFYDCLIKCLYKRIEI